MSEVAAIVGTSVSLYYLCVKHIKAVEQQGADPSLSLRNALAQVSPDLPAKLPPSTLAIRRLMQISREITQLDPILLAGHLNAPGRTRRYQVRRVLHELESWLGQFNGAFR